MIRRCKDGEAEAFKELFNRYRAMISSVMWKMVPEKQDVPDVLQNFFLRAMQNIGTFQEQCRISTWLYKIAFNECLGYLEKKRVEKKYRIGLEDCEGLLEQLPDTEPDPCLALERRETGFSIRRIVEKLDEEKKSVIHLFYDAGLSTEQIAERLNLAVGTVASRLSRAKQEIREFIEQEMKGN